MVSGLMMGGMNLLIQGDAIQINGQNIFTPLDNEHFNITDHMGENIRFLMDPVKGKALKPVVTVFFKGLKGEVVATLKINKAVHANKNKNQQMFFQAQNWLLKGVTGQCGNYNGDKTDDDSVKVDYLGRGKSMFHARNPQFGVTFTKGSCTKSARKSARKCCKEEHPQGSSKTTIRNCVTDNCAGGNPRYACKHVDSDGSSKGSETDWVAPGVYPPGNSNKILCAFLRGIRPNTTDMTAFMADVVKGGCADASCRPVAELVGSSQFGMSPEEFVQTGKAPDIYNLQGSSIAHLDLYNAFFPQVRAAVTQRVDQEGFITYRDTIEIKKNVVLTLAATNEISFGSKLETAIGFIRSGGDLISGKVLADDWLRFIQGLKVPFEVIVGGRGWVDAKNRGMVQGGLEKDNPWN